MKEVDSLGGTIGARRVKIHLHLLRPLLLPLSFLFPTHRTTREDIRSSRAAEVVGDGFRTSSVEPTRPCSRLGRVPRKHHFNTLPHSYLGRLMEWHTRIPSESTSVSCHARKLDLDKVKSKHLKDFGEHLRAFARVECLTVIDRVGVLCHPSIIPARTNFIRPPSRFESLPENR